MLFGNNHKDHIVFIAQYLDKMQLMHKIIIAFKVIGYLHILQYIYILCIIYITNIIRERNYESKIHSFIFDNRAVSKVVINKLT